MTDRSRNCRVSAPKESRTSASRSRSWRNARNACGSAKRGRSAEAVVAALSESGLAKNVTAAGSLRRMEPTVGDLDIICTSSTPKELLEFFATLPLVERVAGQGDTKATVWAKPGISIDCRVVAHECFGNLLQHFTGNKEHNVQFGASSRRRERT